MRSRSVGARQRHRAADARIEPLGHALDDAALARRVAALEQHDQLELVGHHPVLQLDQLALQAQQLGEILPAVDAFRPGHIGDLLGQARQHVVAQLLLQLLVDGVGQFVADAILQRLALLAGVHRMLPSPWPTEGGGCL